MKGRRQMCTRCHNRSNAPIEEVGTERTQLARPDRDLTISTATGDRECAHTMHAELVGFPEARSTDHRSPRLVDLPVG